jgi:hypothetical protein
MDLQEKETLSQVSDATAQEPITIDVDVKPVNKVHGKLQKWGILPKKRSFTLNPITMGSLVKISKLLLDIDMDVYKADRLLESNYEAISKHGETMAKIVAIAITNTKPGPSKRLVSFIVFNFTTKELLYVLSIVMKQMDLTSFMSSIISVKGMNILETKTASAVPAND